MSMASGALNRETRTDAAEWNSRYLRRVQSYGIFGVVIPTNNREFGPSPENFLVYNWTKHSFGSPQIRPWMSFLSLEPRNQFGKVFQLKTAKPPRQKGWLLYKRTNLEAKVQFYESIRFVGFVIWLNVLGDYDLFLHRKNFTIWALVDISTLLSPHSSGGIPKYLTLAVLGVIRFIGDLLYRWKLGFKTPWLKGIAVKSTRALEWDSTWRARPFVVCHVVIAYSPVPAPSGGFGISYNKFGTNQTHLHGHSGTMGAHRQTVIMELPQPVYTTEQVYL